MSVKKPLETQARAEDIDIEKLITKGALVKEDSRKENKKCVNINLRIPASMVHDVDCAVGETVGITRTGWILQAIAEKLKRSDDE